MKQSLQFSNKEGLIEDVKPFKVSIKQIQNRNRICIFFKKGVFMD